MKNAKTTKSGKQKIYFPPCHEDIDLIKKSSLGDHEAFTRLVEIHGKTIKDILYSFGAETDLVEEIYQCVLIKIWRHIKKFRLESSFPTWYYRIARNLFIDYKRKDSKERLVNPSQLLTFDDDRTEEEIFESILADKGDLEEAPSPLEETGRGEDIAEAKKKVKFLFKNLSPNHSEVLRLFDIEGLHCSKIAEKLKISIGTVLSRIHYARENSKCLILKENRKKFYESRF